MSYKKATQEIIDKVKCPYQVFGTDCSMEQVNKAYEAAVKRGRQEGFVPVLVPSDEVLAEWLGILEEEDKYSIEEVRGADCSNGAELLQTRYEEYMEDYAEDFEDSDLQEFMGELDGGEELVWLNSFLSFSSEGIEETILFEIPTDKPWEVFAWLPMGGWNECPQVTEMMAISRYWYEKYGAVPAVVSHDTLEYVLEEPVEEEEAAWELAKEHYAFTPDRVDQCTESGTLGEVADCIRKSTVWYFWWD